MLISKETKHSESHLALLGSQLCVLTKLINHFDKVILEPLKERTIKYLPCQMDQ